MKKLVSILIPCYNEQASLPTLYTELSEVINGLNDYDFEILFVNDGSKDNTLELIKAFHETDKRISYVDLSTLLSKEKFSDMI